MNKNKIKTGMEKNHKAERKRIRTDEIVQTVVGEKLELKKMICLMFVLDKLDVAAGWTI